MPTLIDARDYPLLAGVRLPLSVPGRVFQLMQAPSNVDITFFRNDSQIGNAINMPEGFYFGELDEPFHRVDIVSAVDQTVKIAIAQSKAVLNRIVGSITATISKSTTLVSLPDVVMVNAAKTAIVTANANRRRAFITNLAAGAATLRIADDANVGAARGTPVAPGETVTFETTAAISGWNPGGVNQNVAVVEERD